MKLFWCLVLLTATVILGSGSAAAQATGCVRPTAGQVVAPPPDIYSRNGLLAVTFNYTTSQSAIGHTLFCFVTPDGMESPTLHVNPGDRVVMTVNNLIPKPAPGSPTEVVSNSQNRCGDEIMTLASVNVHFHGMNIGPECHSDQVIHTIINSGETFRYDFTVPANEPPGLYWYHPHVHGISDPALEGGASGLIEVEGIEKLQPVVAGLNQRFLVIRDQLPQLINGPGPSWDISLNYVPIIYPNYVPSVIMMPRGASELWRVVNASSDTIMQLVLSYDGVAQPMTIVALDGVPIGSQDGTHTGTTQTVTGIRLPPAGRAEFIVAAPGPNVKSARLVTPAIDTGPAGDYDPARPLAVIRTFGARRASAPIAAASGPVTGDRFAGLAAATATANRLIYFTETQGTGGHAPPLTGSARPIGTEPGNVLFYITVNGQTPALFDPLAPPAITTTQGAVENWRIENRSAENHEFHIHQIHFLLAERNGVVLPADQQEYLDTVEVPYWTGTGPYPSVTLKMDFRGAVVGDFVFHCHILGHEDGGMMQIVRVQPPPA